MNIEIINPKAMKLLQDLADLNLISISKDENPFIEVVKKLRSQNAPISLEDITKEVNVVRKNNN